MRNPGPLFYALGHRGNGAARPLPLEESSWAFYVLEMHAKHQYVIIALM